MRSVAVISAILVSWSVTDVAGQSASRAEFLLSAGRAGAFEIGEPVDALYRRVGRERVTLVDLFKEGLFSPALEIRLPGASESPALIADIREWPCGDFSVWGLAVRDSRFRTREGLGVGSTAAELRRAYATT
ncbi:MAG TPA: hypothetical protein VFJ02_04750, partial [Vicinamibacterales bacterium]|nr:hypothetical protein [Vicinamibacterales bacterium]